MKPILIYVTYNRLGYTKITLPALASTTDLAAVDFFIVDNGSTDGTQEWLKAFAETNPVKLMLQTSNIGCPQALNLAMEKRVPGQAVIKLDNDGQILSPGWLDKVSIFLETYSDVGIVSATYEDMFRSKRVFHELQWEYGRFWVYYPSGGICTLYSGALLDKVGYFDVLAKEHRYGFEDLLMSAKSYQLGLKICALECWQIANIQRSSAYGHGADETPKSDHVKAMRPHYESRLQRIAHQHIYTNREGILE